MIKRILNAGFVWACETLRGVTLEPACFDPHRSSQQNAFWVIRNYVDSLICKQRDGTYAQVGPMSWAHSFASLTGAGVASGRSITGVSVGIQHFF